MSFRIVLSFALVACAASEQRPAAIGAVVIDSIAPAVAKPGDTVVVMLSTPAGAPTCSAEVAGVPMQCAGPAGDRCTCSLTIGQDLPDGTAAIDVSASGQPGVATAGG